MTVQVGIHAFSSVSSAPFDVLPGSRAVFVPKGPLDNSRALQRRDKPFRVASVPKGRLNQPQALPQRVIEYNECHLWE